MLELDVIWKIEEGKLKPNELNVDFFETSASEDINIHAIFPKQITQTKPLGKSKLLSERVHINERITLEMLKKLNKNIKFWITGI